MSSDASSLSSQLVLSASAPVMHSPAGRKFAPLMAEYFCQHCGYPLEPRRTPFCNEPGNYTKSI